MTSSLNSKFCHQSVHLSAKQSFVVRSLQLDILFYLCLLSMFGFILCFETVSGVVAHRVGGQICDWEVAGLTSCWGADQKSICYHLIASPVPSLLHYYATLQ